MRTVNRSALVPYSADRMFALVNDVDAYPEFLPYCTAATINSREGNVVVACLELTRGQISKSFTTRNTLSPPESIELELVDGPFRHLAGRWAFTPVGNAGCKVELTLEFAFKSILGDAAFGRVFEESCNSLVDAFTRRAAAVHG